jgi:hypothetical protein
MSTLPHGYLVTLGRNDLRHRANSLVGKAIREGRLTRQPCERCGKEPALAHHESYDPGDELKVNWLCPKCHAARHKELRQGLRKFEQDVRREIEHAQKEHKAHTHKDSPSAPTQAQQESGLPATSPVSLAPLPPS